MKLDIITKKNGIFIARKLFKRFNSLLRVLSKNISFNKKLRILICMSQNGYPIAFYLNYIFSLFLGYFFFTFILVLIIIRIVEDFKHKEKAKKYVKL